MFHFKSSNRLFVVLFSCLFFNLSIFADDASSKNDRLQKNVQKLSLLEHIKKQTLNVQNCHQEKDTVDDSSHFAKLHKKFHHLFSEKLQRSIDLIKSRLHEDDLQPLLLTGAIDEKQDRQDQSIIKDLQISAAISIGGSGSSGNDDYWSSHGVEVDDNDYDSGTSSSSSSSADVATTTDTSSKGDYEDWNDRSRAPKDVDYQELLKKAKEKFNQEKAAQDKRSLKRVAKLKEYGYQFQKPEKLAQQLKKAQEEFEKTIKDFRYSKDNQASAETEKINLEIDALKEQELFEQNAVKDIEKKEKEEVEVGTIFLDQYGYKFQSSEKLAQDLQNARNQAMQSQGICDRAILFAWLEDRKKAEEDREKLKDIESKVFDQKLCWQRQTINEIKEKEKEKAKEKAEETIAIQSQTVFIAKVINYAKTVAITTTEGLLSSKITEAEPTQCDLLKQQLATALTNGGRPDLATSINVDIFCEDESLGKEKEEAQLGQDRLLNSSIFYLTLDLGIKLVSNVSYQTLVETATFASGLILALKNDDQKNLIDRIKSFFKKNSQKQDTEKLNKDLEYGCRQLQKLPANFIEPILAQTVAQAMIYDHYENSKIIVLIDDQKNCRYFVLEDDITVLPREIKLEDSSSERQRTALEKEIKKSKEKQAKNQTKTSKTSSSQEPKKSQSQSTQNNSKQPTPTAKNETKQPEPTTSKMDACPPQEPTVFDHPKPETPNFGEGCKYPAHEPEKPKRQGCGSTEPVERPIHTGHEPVEKLPERTPGCGGKVDDLQGPLVLHNKADKSGVKDQGQVNSEPKKGTPEWDKKYPNGKYEESPKHHPNAPKDIGKPPRDGQAGLDKSYDVKNAPSRIAIEDGKYVVYYETTSGVYHAFICDEWKNVPAKARDAFIHHKLVHPKSGDIKKNKDL